MIERLENRLLLSAVGTISGKISYAGNGVGLPFLELYLSPGGESTYTNSFGQYKFAAVPKGGYTIIQPEQENYNQLTPKRGVGLTVTVTAGSNIKNKNFVDSLTLPLPFYPRSPQAVTVVPNGAGVITLAWQPGAIAVNSHLFEFAISASDGLNAVIGNQNDVIVAGFTPGQQYYIQVTEIVRLNNNATASSDPAGVWFVAR